MTDSHSYRTLYGAARRRETYDKVYADLLEKLANDLDLRGVKSCLAMGTGPGEYEVKFMQRFMSNLETLTVVEPDAESVVELRHRLKTELPGVKSVICEVSGQSWTGLDQPVDAVILFRVLFHFSPTERRDLLHKLFSRCVVPGGFVVVETRTDVRKPTSVARLYERLNPNFRPPFYEEIKPDVLGAGFSLLFERDFQYERDFRDADEDLLRCCLLLSDRPPTDSLDDVRKAVAEMYPDGKGDLFYKLVVFKRPQ